MGPLVRAGCPRFLNTWMQLRSRKVALNVDEITLNSMAVAHRLPINGTGSRKLVQQSVEQATEHDHRRFPIALHRLGIGECMIGVGSRA
jgi:hypothetical protein